LSLREKKLKQKLSEHPELRNRQTVMPSPYIISQLHRSTQPGHPAVDRQECQRKLWRKQAHPLRDALAPYIGNLAV